MESPKKNSGSSLPRLLLVEDDADILELLSGLLKKNGYEVVVCNDGNKAVRAFKEGQYDLVILDCMLQGKNGYAICQEIRLIEGQKRTPVIFLSALAQKLEIAKGLEVGGDVYITKPYDNAHLLAEIKRLLSR